MLNKSLSESDIMVLAKLSEIPPGKSFKRGNIQVTRIDNYLFDIRVVLDENRRENVTRILLDDL